MFTSVLVVPDVGTVSLYLWAMSSSIQGISVFIRASILVLIFIVGSVAKRNIGMFLSFRVFGGRGRREVQNDIKPMMNPIELPLLNQTISNPFPIDIGAFGPERIVSPIMTPLGCRIYILSPFL